MPVGSRKQSLCIFASLMLLCNNISCFRVYNHQMKRKARLSLGMPSTIRAPILDKSVMAQAEEFLEAGKKTLGLQTDNPAEFMQLNGSIFESTLNNRNKLNESTLVQNGIKPGEQLLALSGDGKELHVDALVNVTEDSAEFTSLGNSSVAADVFEMVMEKEIPGGKGKPQGKQEIRIVQMDQVKPLSNEEITVPSVIKKRGIYDRVTEPKLRALHVVKRTILSTQNKRLKKDVEWVPNNEDDYQQIETSPVVHDVVKVKQSSTEIGDISENASQNVSLYDMLDDDANKKSGSLLHLNHLTADKKHIKSFIDNDQEYSQTETNEKSSDEDSSQVYSLSNILPDPYIKESGEDSIGITGISKMKIKQHRKTFMTNHSSKQLGYDTAKVIKYINKPSSYHKINTKNMHLYKENGGKSEAAINQKNHEDQIRIFIISFPYSAYRPRRTELRSYRNHIQRKHHKSSKPFLQNKLLHSIRDVNKGLALINNINEGKGKRLPQDEPKFEMNNESINDPQTWKISEGHSFRKSKKIVNISDFLNLDILKQKLFMKSDVKSVEKIVLEDKGDREFSELIAVCLILLGIALGVGILIIGWQYERKIHDHRNFHIHFAKHGKQLMNSFAQMAAQNQPKQILWSPEQVKRNDLKFQYFATNEQDGDSGSPLEWQSESGEWLSDNESKERTSRSFSELSRNRQIK